MVKTTKKWLVAAFSAVILAMALVASLVFGNAAFASADEEEPAVYDPYAIVIAKLDADGDEVLSSDELDTVLEIAADATNRDYLTAIYDLLSRPDLYAGNPLWVKLNRLPAEKVKVCILNTGKPCLNFPKKNG